jgi:succinoglycan biosynthesis protein ExoM
VSVSVSVIIPTFRRPAGLRAAIQSVLIQTHKPDQLIIVDNAPEGGAEAMVRTATAISKFDVTYVHEPRAGVSNARNAALAQVKTRYVAFLDDDEVADPHWLAALLETSQTCEAGAVFGPLRADAGAIPGVRGGLVRRLYSRVGPETDSPLDTPFGCGNSLIDLEAIELPETPFDPALNETGGEDDVFFAMLQDQGARFAWSARASAIEVVEPRRAEWRYLTARSFAFGQGATQHCARRQNPDWPGVAFWMLVGLAQLAVFAPLAGLAVLTRARKAAELIDRTIQAAGKMIWFDQFEPRFYGDAASVTDPGPTIRKLGRGGHEEHPAQ